MSERKRYRWSDIEQAMRRAQSDSRQRLVGMTRSDTLYWTAILDLELKKDWYACDRNVPLVEGAIPEVVDVPHFNRTLDQAVKDGHAHRLSVAEFKASCRGEPKYHTPLEHGGIGNVSIYLLPDQLTELQSLKQKHDALMAKTEHYAVMHGWLVGKVDVCNCGFGGPEGHHPECGWEPLVEIDVLRAVFERDKEALTE